MRIRRFCLFYTVVLLWPRTENERYTGPSDGRFGSWARTAASHVSGHRLWYFILYRRTTAPQLSNILRWLKGINEHNQCVTGQGKLTSCSRPPTHPSNSSDLPPTSLPQRHVLCWRLWSQLSAPPSDGVCPLVIEGAGVHFPVWHLPVIWHPSQHAVTGVTRVPTSNAPTGTAAPLLFSFRLECIKDCLRIPAFGSMFLFFNPIVTYSNIVPPKNQLRSDRKTRILMTKNNKICNNKIY